MSKVLSAICTWELIIHWPGHLLCFWAAKSVIRMRLIIELKLRARDVLRGCFNQVTEA